MQVKIFAHKNNIYSTQQEDIAPVSYTHLDVYKRQPMTQIKNTPSILGEADVMKAIQLMPGVQAGMEGSAGLYVRGGGPDQNLILLDLSLIHI